MLNLLGGSFLEVPCVCLWVFSLNFRVPPSSPLHWLELPMNSLNYYAASAWSLLPSADRRFGDNSLQFFSSLYVSMPRYMPSLCGFVISSRDETISPSWSPTKTVDIVLCVVDTGNHSYNCVYCGLMANCGIPYSGKCGSHTVQHNVDRVTIVKLRTVSCAS